MSMDLSMRLMEFSIRSIRAYVLDDAGKKADLLLSSSIYKKTLSLGHHQRPQSSGQWASQVREFESVRDFVSSSTLVILTDIPFSILFFAVIFWMGGVIVWIPIIASILIIIAGAITQIPIRKSVERYQYENTQKHAMLIESLERLETIEALGVDGYQMTQSHTNYDLCKPFEIASACCTCLAQFD